MNETVTRFISGVVYVVLLLTATTCSVHSFYILFGLFMLVAIYEFCAMEKINMFIPIVVGALGYYAAVSYKIEKTVDIILLSVTLITSVYLVKLLFTLSTVTISSVAKYAFVLGYVILPFIIITRIPFAGSEFRPKILISIFILIWTNDTFAYLVGKNFGKRKLFEKISPKKTIEGFVGGMLFTVIAGILISRYYFNPSPQYASKSLLIWAVTAVIISVFSTLGDLIESKFKRMAGVKDSGKIMPGHGGILDRLDSIIFVAPFVFLFYQILYYVS